MMILLQPIWLLLAIPLAIALWAWPLPGRGLNILRIVAIVLILLAMSGPAIRVPSRLGTVVVVADRSYSMPPGSDAREKESITLVERGRDTDDSLAVVSFGANAAIELSPRASGFDGFKADVKPDASNLALALETALALIPEDSPGRILILSDGRYTGSDPLAVAAQAASREVSIDHRVLQRETANDVAVMDIDAPDVVAPGESFMVTGWVRCPVAQKVTYELARGDVVIARGEREMTSGINRLIFRDQAGEGGAQRYQLRVSGPQEDPVIENNTARRLVGVSGPRPILCVAESGRSGLSALLEAGKISIVSRKPGDCQWALEDLAKYSAVILENVEANGLGVPAMQNLAAWVTEHGAGIMMTGGKASYGPGGYFRSPLEPIMPVSMELRQEHRKLRLAIVVALDRSGSMSMPVGGGKCKMDLADLASAEVVNLLGPEDEVGVLAVDSSAHVIADLDKIKNQPGLRSRILKIESMGGGIFVYEALVNAAKMLQKAEAGTRHIILFADAADSEEPGDYVKLLDACRKANITISVIGLGTDRDVDAGLLKDIAKRGGGRIFFTTDAHQLPRLFAQDTFVVARSTFSEEPVSVRATPGLMLLAARNYTIDRQVGGYNLTYVRPEATLAAVTLDEYKAPLAAAWTAGVGRTLCYTGEADGKYTGAIAKWPDVGDFFSSLARWTSGHTAELPGDMLVTQELQRGTCVIQLHLNPERDVTPFTDLPTVTTLRGRPGETPAVLKSQMAWSSPDTLTLSLPLRGDETALSSVEVTAAMRAQLSPVCLPYSPEYRPVEAEEGVDVLQRLAKATGGRHRVELAEIWTALPRRPRNVDISRWLMICAAIVFLLEILERRTGLLFTRQKKPEAVAGGEAQASAAAPRRWKIPIPRLRRRKKPAAAAAVEETPPLEPEPEPKRRVPLEPQPRERDRDVIDAMRQARRRAKGRME